MPRKRRKQKLARLLEDNDPFSRTRGIASSKYKLKFGPYGDIHGNPKNYDDNSDEGGDIFDERHYK